MPTSGLTLYIPYDTSTLPKIGEPLTSSFGSESAPVLTSYQGVDCAYFDGNVKIGNANGDYFTTYKYDPSTQTYAPHFSTSQWFCTFNDISLNNYMIITNVGKDISTYSGDALMLGKNNPKTDLYWCKMGRDPAVCYTGDMLQWHHIVETYEKTSSAAYACKVTIYVDGVKTYESTNSYNQSHGSPGFYIGCRPNNAAGTVIWTAPGIYGCLAGVRVYDRILTTEEIALLATEYKPLVSPVFNDQSLIFDNDTGATSKQLSFDNKGRAYSFRITAGTLPQGVIFNGSTGTFTYDGTEVLQDQDYTN